MSPPLAIIMPFIFGGNILKLNIDLIKTILAGFPYDLRKHSLNVCYLSQKLANYIGCTDKQKRTLIIGALLHDMGKICIDESILNKPGKLTFNEFLIVKQHTILGVKMLEYFTESHEILPIILYHHERWDGKGYEGLAGRNIPKLARIVTLADAFDAMTCSRPYQKPKTLTDALKELNIKKGIQFESRLVELFEACILDSIKKPYETHTSEFVEQLTINLY